MLIAHPYPQVLFMGKNVESGNFFPLKGGGSPIPTFSNHETTQKVNIFMKTKKILRS